MLETRPAKFNSIFTGDGLKPAATRGWCERDEARPPCVFAWPRRQRFRLLETESTGMTCGCRSSVNEMTGNNSARTQTMAIASVRKLTRGLRRETLQRKRQIQSAPSAIPNHNRLRMASIVIVSPAGRTDPRIVQLARASSFDVQVVYTVARIRANWARSHFRIPILARRFSLWGKNTILKICHAVAREVAPRRPCGAPMAGGSCRKSPEPWIYTAPLVP